MRIYLEPRQQASCKPEDESAGRLQLNVDHENTPSLDDLRALLQDSMPHLAEGGHIAFFHGHARLQATSDWLAQASRGQETSSSESEVQLEYDVVQIKDVPIRHVATDRLSDWINNIFSTETWTWASTCDGSLYQIDMTRPLPSILSAQRFKKLDCSITSMTAALHQGLCVLFLGAQSGRLHLLYRRLAGAQEVPWRERVYAAKELRLDGTALCYLSACKGALHVGCESGLFSTFALSCKAKKAPSLNPVKTHAFEGGLQDAILSSDSLPPLVVTSMYFYVHGGEQQGYRKVQLHHAPHNSCCAHAALGGRHLVATGHANGHINLFAFDGLSLEHRGSARIPFSSSERWISGISFTDPAHLATVGVDGYLRVWQVVDETSLCLVQEICVGHKLLALNCVRHDDRFAIQCGGQESKLHAYIAA